LAERPCVTRTLNVHGFHSNAERFGTLSVYGSDALGIQDLMRRRRPWRRHCMGKLPYTRRRVVWAARHEMARTVEGSARAAHAGAVPETRVPRKPGSEVARRMAANLAGRRDNKPLSGLIH
jgi:glycerol-3-phosphate dehydrogenase